MLRSRTVRSGSGAVREGSRWWKAFWSVEAVVCQRDDGESGLGPESSEGSSDPETVRATERQRYGLIADIEGTKRPDDSETRPTEASRSRVNGTAHSGARTDSGSDSSRIATRDVIARH